MVDGGPSEDVCRPWASQRLGGTDLGVDVPRAVLPSGVADAVLHAANIAVGSRREDRRTAIAASYRVMATQGEAPPALWGRICRWLRGRRIM